MVTSFDISQEIFSIDMLTALKFSLKHRRKHVLRPLQLCRDQAQVNDFFLVKAFALSDKLDGTIISAINKMI